MYNIVLSSPGWTHYYSGAHGVLLVLIFLLVVRLIYATSNWRNRTISTFGVTREYAIGYSLTACVCWSCKASLRSTRWSSKCWEARTKPRRQSIILYDTLVPIRYNRVQIQWLLPDMQIFNIWCSWELMFFFACVLAVVSWVLGGGKRLENVCGSVLSCGQLYLVDPTWTPIPPKEPCRQHWRLSINPPENWFDTKSFIGQWKTGKVTDERWCTFVYKDMR